MENININSIFKKLKNDKLFKNKKNHVFKDEFLNVLNSKKNFKIIIGINSNNSFEKLKKYKPKLFKYF